MNQANADGVCERKSSGRERMKIRKERKGLLKEQEGERCWGFVSTHVRIAFLAPVIKITDIPACNWYFLVVMHDQYLSPAAILFHIADIDQI